MRYHSAAKGEGSGGRKALRLSWNLRKGADERRLNSERALYRPKGVKAADGHEGDTFQPAEVPLKQQLSCAGGAKV